MEEEEEIIFYNSKLRNFKEISKEENYKNLKELAEEKADFDKILNYPYMIKLIINKIKEDTENLKKSDKAKANNSSNTINNTFTHKSNVSYSQSNYNNSTTNSESGFNTVNTINTDRIYAESENIYIIGIIAKNLNFKFLYFQLKFCKRVY